MKFDRVQMTTKGLRETKPREWIARFIFGGLISALAGWVGQTWGPAVGGLFLAFPSILPATITLLKEHDGKDEAADDACGASMGSVGLAAFAAIIFFGAGSWGFVATLTVATIGWTVTGLLVWSVFGK